MLVWILVLTFCKADHPGVCKSGVVPDGFRTEAACIKAADRVKEVTPKDALFKSYVCAALAVPADGQKS